MIPIASPVIGTEEKENILKVLESGNLASGKWVEKFEEAFASYIGCKYGVATSSGSTALRVALEAAGIQKGDKVLTTPFSFVASSNAILQCGAIPVFGDIEPDTYNLSPESIEEELKKDPLIKGLLIVHLFGQPCDMKKIVNIANRYKLTLIEDCAQAHGAEILGKKVGAFGKCSAFSFYGTKNMTTGEGGMVLTNNLECADRCRLLINHGSKAKYQHVQLGYNYRLTNLAAAIGLAQLKTLDDCNQKRISNARYLKKNLNTEDSYKLPLEVYGKHVFHQFTLQVQDRDKFSDYLVEKGIGFGIHYPIPINAQIAYTDLGYKPQKTPVALDLAGKVIAIPVHPSLKVSELDYIIQSLQNYKK